MGEPLLLDNRKRKLRSSKYSNHDSGRHKSTGT